VSYVTHDAADDNDIERRLEMRPTFEHKTKNKILTPNGFPPEKDGDVERGEYPQLYK